MGEVAKFWLLDGPVGNWVELVSGLRLNNASDI